MEEKEGTPDGVGELVGGLAERDDVRKGRDEACYGTFAPGIKEADGADAGEVGAQG